MKVSLKAESKEERCDEILKLVLSSVSVSDLLEGRRAHLTGRRRKPALLPETWSLQAVSQGLEHLQSFLWGGQKHQLVPHGLLLWNTSMCAKKDQKIKGLSNQWRVIVLTVHCGTCLPISASCFATRRTSEELHTSQSCSPSEGPGLR